MSRPVYVDTVEKNNIFKKLRSKIENKVCFDCPARNPSWASETTHRSCELDEWTQEQLNIMTVSGNGNAREFFKKHGVTEAQMGSEKKYSSKAAPEYKKHIAKLLNEMSGHSLATRTKSDEAIDVKGLDGLMHALSTSAATAAPQVAQVPVQQPVETVFRATPSPVMPKGTLNISAAVSTDNLVGSATSTPPPAIAEAGASVPAAEPTDEDNAAAANAAGADALLKLHKMAGKKPIASKKAGMGARKIVTNTPSDVRIESFESVEKRAAASAQEQEDRKLAVQLQQQESATAAANASSGRVAAMMAEAESPAKASIYRSTSNTASTASVNSTRSTNSPKGYRSAGTISNSATASGNSTTAAKGGAESFAARDKYTNQKGISSDQFFGRDQEDAETMRTRLGQYSGSSGISSDMMYGRGRAESDDDGSSATLEKLKDSVAGFFDSFNK